MDETRPSDEERADLDALASGDAATSVEPPASEPAASEPAASEPSTPEPADEGVAEVAPVDDAEADGADDDSGPSDEGGVSLLDDWQPGEWFVVHTYAGYENKVKANLLTRIQSMNMEDRIYEVVIPMEDVVEMKGGKKQVVQRKVFPGYLLVRMDLDDDSWYVVRNTPGVTGFVGSASKPIPLSESEVDNILKRGEAAEEERPRPRAEWQVNDPVRVTTGPFANFQGVVSEIDLDRSKLKVLVNIFGRETPVELGFDQVSKV